MPAGKPAGPRPKAIKPEQAGTAAILGNAFGRFRRLLNGLGIGRFEPTTMPEGTIGLGVHPDDLTHIAVDLDRLHQNLARLKTPEARQARVDRVIREEIITRSAQDFGQEGGRGLRAHLESHGRPGAGSGAAHLRQRRGAAA